MRLFISLIAIFALLFTLAAATTPDDDEHDRVTISLFRPWTWSLPLPLPAMAEADAASLHVRRHGPRRRAMHP
ncbi:hypothetical protein B0H17DRAFT_1091416 [Mycena rosella]|uniref:Uncharacterized protein n=1 Tax=Mycena rosella TaxID=1033263 RepID=A0AAD7G7P1_MYCRO|nr:hypothetical protein B0H17DRAFT_1091416 [Mycena rosella]